MSQQLLNEIESFVSGVFRPVVNILTGGISSVAYIPEDISNFSSSLSKAFAQFVSVLSALPGDVLNFFQTLGGSIMGGLERLGSWLFSGLSSLGSHLASALKVAFAPISDAFHYFVTLGSQFVSWLSGVASFILSAFTNFYNALSGALGTAFNFFNDIVSLINGFLGYVPQAVNGFSKFVSDSINFLATGGPNIVNYAQQAYKHFTDSVPFDILKQESSKFGRATARAIGFNTAMEVIKSTVRNSWLVPNINPFMRAVMIAFSPFVAGLSGYLTEAFLRSFYPDIQTTTVQRYSPLTVTTQGVPQHTTHVPLSTGALRQATLQLPGAPSAPGGIASPSFRPGHIITVYVHDFLKLYDISAYGAIVSASQFVQLLVDTLDMSFSLAVRVVPLLSVAVTDLLEPEIGSLVTTSTTAFLVTTYVNVEAIAGNLAVPIGSSFCRQYSIPTTYFSTETATDFVNVYYSICVDLTKSNVDVIYFFVTTAVPTTQLTDTLTLQATTLAPTTDLVDDLLLLVSTSLPSTFATLTDSLSFYLYTSSLPSTFATLTDSLSFYLYTSLPFSPGATSYFYTTESGTTAVGGVTVTTSTTFTPAVKVCYSYGSCASY